VFQKDARLIDFKIRSEPKRRDASNIARLPDLLGHKE
jgi:hypothetical protein